MKTILLILFFVSIAAMVYIAMDRFGHTVLRGLNSGSKNVQKRFEREFIKINSHLLAVAAAGIGAAAIILSFVTKSVTCFIFVPPVLTISLHLLFKAYVYRRNRKVLGQLPAFLDLAETYSKAGITFAQSLLEITEKVKPPMRDEIKIITGNVNIGLPLEESLRSLYERIPAEETLITCLAISNCIKNGANVAEMLEKIKYSLLEKERMEKKLKAQTSQGKLQGIFLTFVPLIFMVSLNAVMPGYLHTILSVPIGRLLILIVSAMLVLGWLLIYKIIKPEV